MKIKNYLVAFMAALSIVGCSDDKEIPNPTNEAAKAVVGEYEGLMSMAVNGKDMNELMVKLTLTAEEGGTISISVPELPTMGSSKLAAFSLTGVEIKAKQNGSFTISGASREVTSGETNLTVSEISGTITSDKKAKITMKIKPGAMPFHINCTFDTEAELNVAKVVAGEYEGLMSMAVGGEPVGEPTPMTITLSDEEGETLRMTVPAMAGMGTMQLPTFDLTGVEVKSESDGSYSFSHAGADVDAGKLVIKVSDMKGSMTPEKKVKLTMNITPGAMPMAITCTFESKTEPTEEK